MGTLGGEGVMSVITVLVTPVVGGGGDHSPCEVGVVIGEFNFKSGFCCQQCPCLSRSSRIGDIFPDGLDRVFQSIID